MRNKWDSLYIHVILICIHFKKEEEKLIIQSNVGGKYHVICRCQKSYIQIILMNFMNVTTTTSGTSQV